MTHGPVPLGFVVLTAALLVSTVHAADTRDAEDPAAVSAPDEPSGAQADSPTPARPYGFRTLGRDTRYLFTRPAHLDRQGWTRLGATLAAAGGLFALRHEIRDFSQEHLSTGRTRLLDDVRGIMGGPGLAVGLSLATWAASFATHEDREKETAQLLLESLGYSVAVAGVGQFVLASERPREGVHVHFFHLHGHGVSGDASIAASIVAPIRRQYLRIDPDDTRGRRFLKRAGTGLLYGGAILTAWQRVNSESHWAPDAFLGLANGFAVGEMLCDAHALARERRVAFSVVPVRGGGTAARISFDPDRAPH
ncbi:MAG: hypothetical protein LAO51_08410 [Acidobacteriia bacterium]|nr:hypothetical protein [Terriglobia bacterium]